MESLPVPALQVLCRGGLTQLVVSGEGLTERSHSPTHQHPVVKDRFYPSCVEVSASQDSLSELRLVGAGGEVNVWLGGGGRARAGGGWRRVEPRGVLAAKQSTPSPDKEPSESYLPNPCHTRRSQRGPGPCPTGAWLTLLLCGAQEWQAAAPDAGVPAPQPGSLTTEEKRQLRYY